MGEEGKEHVRIVLNETRLDPRDFERTVNAQIALLFTKSEHSLICLGNAFLSLSTSMKRPHYLVPRANSDSKLLPNHETRVFQARLTVLVQNEPYFLNCKHQPNPGLDPTLNIPLSSIEESCPITLA